MKPKVNKKILIISSAFMLLISLPMMLFTFNMVYSASPYDKSGESLQSIGLLIGAGIYIFSMLVAIAGLSFANKPYKYNWCSNLGLILMLITLLDAILLRAYFIITMLPLLILNIIYITGTRNNAEIDSNRNL